MRFATPGQAIARCSRPQLALARCWLCAPRMGQSAFSHPPGGHAVRPDGYQRREPEQTALYKTLAAHWPEFLEHAEELGGLPRFVVSFGVAFRLIHSGGEERSTQRVADSGQSRAATAG